MLAIVEPSKLGWNINGNKFAYETDYITLVIMSCCRLEPLDTCMSDEGWIPAEIGWRTFF